MSVLDYPACTACGKHASDLKKKKDDASTPETTTTKMLVCSRCQSNANRLVHYCSRECQVSHYKVHKPICGVDLTSPTRATIAPTLHARPDAPFQPPQSLLFHLAALTTLPPTAWPAATSPPSFLFFPTTGHPSSSSSSKEGTAPDFIPIVLPEPARNLFNCLQLVAFETGNPISVNLMYSILLDEVAALGGAEPRLVEQLSQEYRLDGSPSDDDKDKDKEEGEPKRRPTLRSVIDDESEPSVEQLFEAIGGQKNTRILVDWQVYESERKRTANAAARQKEQQEDRQSKGMRRGGARKGRR